LPFGFCESPAEFQKRLFQVLQPFIREDRILVYIDDVLIPTVTVEENLATIKDVLLRLKQYGFQLNYKKPFLLVTFSEKSLLQIIKDYKSEYDHVFTYLDWNIN